MTLRCRACGRRLLKPGVSVMRTTSTGLSYTEILGPVCAFKAGMVAPGMRRVVATLPVEVQESQLALDFQ